MVATTNIHDGAQLGNSGFDAKTTQAIGNQNVPNAAGTPEFTKIPQDTNANRYVWQIPAGVADQSCVVRLRYNISTSDYKAWNNDGSMGGNTVNASLNGADKSPVTQDPYVTINSAAAADEFVSLAVNTNQYGRVFQDRSYVFEIRSRPATIPAATPIINLNVRGKRGNIVQTYPSVEYDFVPNDIRASVGDYIHFQWTGSDYNPRRGCNDAEGGPPDANTAANANKNSRADRTNLVPLSAQAMNYPAVAKTAAGTTQLVASQSVFSDEATMQKLAFLDQTATLAAKIDPATDQPGKCLTQAELNAINNKNRRENHPNNCAKLNAAFTPYFDGGAQAVTKTGKFKFFSSRNNNFSNRDQTGKICVIGAAYTQAQCELEENPMAATDATLDVAQQLAVQTSEAALSAAFQLQSDQAQAVTASEILLQAAPGETFQTKDNDSLGDGEAQGTAAGCQTRDLTPLMIISVFSSRRL